MTSKLADRITEDGITAEVTFTGHDRDAEGWEHDAWSVMLMHNGEILSVPFRMGAGHNRRMPEVAEVLESLLSDASGVENARNFEDWASEYGYDTDSRRAEQTYRQAAEQTEGLRQLLGDKYEAYLWETDY